MTDTRPSPQPWPPPWTAQPPARPDRRPVVLAAVIAGAAGLLLGAVLGGVVVFALGSSGAFAPDTLTRGPGGSLPRFDLTVGQCANGEVKPGNSFGSDAAVLCSQPHDLEVYSSTVAPGEEQRTPYPPTDDLSAFADDHCVLAFEEFVGSDLDNSDLGFAGIVPSRAAWEAGDRRILCALWLYDGGPMTGSAGGSGR